MRVAVDSGPLSSGHKVRGVGWYTGELIRALGKRVDAVDFVNADLGAYDIVHYPYFSPFQRTLPLRKPAKRMVVTIHDLIPLIYPRHYPSGIVGSINFFLQRLALKNADVVITDTETSKKDIVRFLKINPEKIFVVYLAAREIFKKLDSKGLELIRKKYDLPQKFVLYVGDINYNKNIPNLVKACELAKMQLVICGKQASRLEELDLNHPELSHLKPVITRLKKVKRLGFVPEEDLVAIYNLADVYCQPSFYEGFGLPVLEALACGTKVVAARTQALVEITEGAVIFTDQQDPEKMAEAFKKNIEKPHLPRNYSWRLTADETFEVYKKVFEAKG